MYIYICSMLLWESNQRYEVCFTMIKWFYMESYGVCFMIIASSYQDIKGSWASYIYMKRYDVCFMTIAVYHQGKLTKDSYPYSRTRLCNLSFIYIKQQTYKSRFLNIFCIHQWNICCLKMDGASLKHEKKKLGMWSDHDLPMLVHLRVD